MAQGKIQRSLLEEMKDVAQLATECTALAELLMRVYYVTIRETLGFPCVSN